MARRFLISAFAAAALFAAQAHAQTEPIWSNVTCTDQLWSLNSAGWTPCLVSAHLSAQCTTDNSWGVPAVGTQGPYSPPNGTYANNCRCNSVQWNLLSACSMCQGGGAGTWQRWTVNCSSAVTTTPNEGGYPLPIPSGVLVPHWAYYDFTLSGVFNAVLASQQTGAESSAVAATPTGSSASATGAPRTTSATAVATSVTSSDDSKSGGSNTGAIAGGVVGGILGVALIAVIAFIVVRKNKQNKSAGAESQFNQSHYAPSMGTQPGAPMMGQYQPVVQHSGMSPAVGSEYKPYDPSDPSTFPSNIAPSHYAESIPYSHQTQARPGQYNGAPEI